MQREKLFLSIIYLVLCLFSSLASIPLLVTVISDFHLATTIGAVIFLVLPVISLLILWRATTQNPYALRRWSFLAWGAITGLLGLGNMALPKTPQNIYGNLIVVGLALLAMTMHVKKKEAERNAKKAQDTKA